MTSHQPVPTRVADDAPRATGARMDSLDGRSAAAQPSAGDVACHVLGPERYRRLPRGTAACDAGGSLPAADGLGGRVINNAARASRTGASLLRFVAVVAFLALAACTGSGDGDATARPSSGPATPPGVSAEPSPDLGTRPSSSEERIDPDATTAGSFLNLNGWMWFYTTADEIRFAEITSMLDDLHDGGIRVIGVYCPYDGDVDKWLGAMPVDFYDTPSHIGTLDDFTELVDAAHARGMKVVTYFGNMTVDRKSEFFRTAERQYAAGDRTSPEVSAFHWTDNRKDPLPAPEPVPGPNKWKYSVTAGAFYWSLWGEAGFDLNLPGAREEVTRFETFWLDTGIDGFMWDAGVADPILREAMVDLPVNHTPNDKWITFEVTTAENADAYVDFGLTSWFNLEDNDEENDYSLIADGPAEADDLEEAMAAAEEAHGMGKLTHAWSPWEPDAYPDDRMLVQEAALLSGGGIAYGAPTYTNFLDWPADVRTDWQRVLTTVNANAALLPAASRTRMPAGDDPKAYAMRATAADGSQTALLVYNLRDEPATVPVDVSGTGIATDQTPVDLYAGGSAAPIAGRTYPVDLPAHGFAMLEVQAAN